MGRLPERRSSGKWMENEVKRTNILFYWLKDAVGGSGHSTIEWKKKKRIERKIITWRKVLLNSEKNISSCAVIGQL